MYKPNPIRRQLAIAAPAVPAFPGLLNAKTTDARLCPTPRQTDGSFHPRHLKGDLDNDLRVPRMRVYRAGQPALVAGNAARVCGQQLPDAIV